MIVSHSVYVLAAIVFAVVLLTLCLIRSIAGPKLVDRIMAVNMIGTLVTTAIVLASIYLDEGSLLDIGMIYVSLSFIGIIVLSEVYIGNYRKKKYYGQKHKREVPEDDD